MGRLLHPLYNCGELALGTRAREVHEAVARDDDPEGAPEAALRIEAAHHLVHLVRVRARFRVRVRVRVKVRVRDRVRVRVRPPRGCGRLGGCLSTAI